MYVPLSCALDEPRALIYPSLALFYYHHSQMHVHLSLMCSRPRFLMLILWFSLVCVAAFMLIQCHEFRPWKMSMFSVTVSEQAVGWTRDVARGVYSTALSLILWYCAVDCGVFRYWMAVFRECTTMMFKTSRTCLSGAPKIQLVARLRQITTKEMTGSNTNNCFDHDCYRII